VQWRIRAEASNHLQTSWLKDWLQQTGLANAWFKTFRELLTVVQESHDSLPIMIPAPSPPAPLKRETIGYSAADGALLVKPIHTLDPQQSYAVTATPRWYVTAAIPTANNYHYYYNQLAHITEEAVTHMLQNTGIIPKPKKTAMYLHPMSSFDTTTTIVTI
jgi:hypothetical protein